LNVTRPRCRLLATQILPFGDPVSFGGYIAFETCNSLRQKRAA
jgi:hypothetical protein